MANKLTTKKIKIRGFTYYKRVPHPSEPDKEIVQAAFATRGDEVELSENDVKRGEEIGAFVNEEEDAVQATADFNVVDASDDEIEEYLENENPNVKETVALANGDKESAERILAAERSLTGGAPRKGVEDGLTEIIEG